MMTITMVNYKTRRPLAVYLILSFILLLAAVACRPRPPIPPTATVSPATMTPTATVSPATATPEPAEPTATATQPPTATMTPAEPTATVSPATMTPTATVSPATPTPVIPEDQIVTGYSSYYAAGVFDQVIQVHRDNGWGNLPEDLTGAEAAAVIGCDFWGQTLYVRPVDLDGQPLSEWVSLTVVDCAGDRLTVDWATANNVIIEVDESLYNEWLPLKTSKGLRVQVYLEGLASGD